MVYYPEVFFMDPIYLKDTPKAFDVFKKMLQKCTK